MLSNIPDRLPPGLTQEPSSTLRAHRRGEGETLATSSGVEATSGTTDFPRCVLLVEPAPTERARLRNVLIGGKLEVSTASDLITALQAVTHSPPDVILAQMRMPMHGGFDLLRRMKEHNSARSIPVILYGGVATAEQRIKALNLGAADLISEPFVSAELIARLHACLRARHKLSVLERRAHLDDLTGLANRGVLEDHLLRQWNACRRRSAPLAVVMLDLDFFKRINDSYGHAAGDEVLRQTARTLVQSVRSGDLAARYGGEEFVIVAADCSLEAAAAMAQRFRTKLAERTISVSGALIRVTASAGVAFTDWVHPVTAENLLHQADMALFQAKASGRNAVWIHPGMVQGDPAGPALHASAPNE